MKISFMMWIACIPRRVINKVFNVFAGLFCGSKMYIDWLDLKVINYPNISIGSRFSVGRGLWIEAVGNGLISIGSDVNMSDWVHIAAASSVVIGDGVLIGSKVIITDHSHGSVTRKLNGRLDENKLRPADREIVSKGPVVIGRNCWLGDGVVVLPGVVIGEGCIIGANSIITRDVDSYSVVVGSAAKKLLS